jgi:hypothetical protein
MCSETVLFEAIQGALSGKPFLNDSASTENGDFGQRRLIEQASTRIGLRAHLPARAFQVDCRQAERKWCRPGRNVAH